MRTLLKIAVFFTLILMGVLYTRPADKLTQLENVLQNNQLVVVTRNAASTYYEDVSGPAGPEFDLVKMFAERLNVELKFVIASDLEQMFTTLAQGKAHFAAAGLTQTQDRQKLLRFTPPYQHIAQQLIYRQGSPRPKSITDLKDGKLVVVAGSSHVEQLRELRGKYPDLTWEESLKFSNDELLQKVESGQIDYTVIDSNELELSRGFYPHVRVAFELSQEQPVGWAFSVKTDDTLYRQAVNFFVDIYNNGILEQILERYYGHISEFDYVATTTFMRHIQKRLPNYRKLFEQAAETHNFDWRLLAAMAYQESHWNPRAISPTGVRGIMMLTRITAKQMGVKKRTDPVQSIRGGSRYLRLLKDRLPPEIGEPDRNWLALAAYNIGYGHLMDARNITQQTGGNPDLWMDVKRKLPLLRDKNWYKNTVYGFARGDEAVQYVENIRSYYQILLKDPDSTVELVSAS
ncbi:MAG TPA: membrane-bound lytic murein transglycosylase MltF [Gammaproteobacteria bacterium]|nr:membrane-bound lytic murein transglycosylase MltF [Gammaproteobacteria bacterium]